MMGLGGRWRDQVRDAARAVALTMVLFAGPLFESVVVDEKWRGWRSLGIARCKQVAREMRGNWTFWKQVVVCGLAAGGALLRPSPPDTILCAECMVVTTAVS